MKHNDDTARALTAAGRRIPSPPVDVVDQVMRSLRQREVASSPDRTLSFEAVLALFLAIAVLIPAQRSVASLLDPLIVLFSSVEVALR